MTKTKTCTMCGEEKPATVEYFYKRGNGFHSRCKVCRKAHYEANKETLLERHKAYYYRDPRRKWTIIKAAAKRRNINFSLPFELYETQLWGKPCHYCGCGLEVTGLDRKDSSKGYSRDNVVPCCGLCNIKKNTKPYEQFIQEQKESRGS